MIVKLMFEVWKVSPKSNVCVRSKSVIKATYSVEESASFIDKEGTVEEKVSSGLNILTTVA